uniref:Uncharacterized protein n=1 Tax=Arundo donax TaxID=35708 RepID=A0A0A8ZK55_ARUDO
MQVDERGGLMMKQRIAIRGVGDV